MTSTGRDPRMRTMCVMVDLHDDDPVSASVRSEVVIEILGGFTPGVEIVEPGTYLIPVLGPARYHGGEEPFARLVYDGVSQALVPSDEDPSWDHRSSANGLPHGPSIGQVSVDPPPVVVVMASGPRMSALVALGLMDAGMSSGPARRTTSVDHGPGPHMTSGSGSTGSRGVLVLGEGADVEFLAPMPIGHLGHLIDRGTLDLFLRLGLGTIGSFADLATSDVGSRFGPEVAEVHRLVNGIEREPSRPRDPAEDMSVVRLMEPPLDTVDQVAFVGRAMADELVERLSSRSLGADTVLIAAETDSGLHIERIWRVYGGLSVSVITQRVRWQIEGWLRSRQRMTDRRNPDGVSDVGAVSSLRIEPGCVRPYRGEQIGFWGEVDDHDRLVLSGIDRIRGLFGADAVRAPRALGGRSPHQSHHMVDVDDDPLIHDGPPSGGSSRSGRSFRAGRSPQPGAASISGSSPTLPGAIPMKSSTASSVEAPWPGSIPDPFPTRVWKDPIPAEVIDAQGRHIGVSGRGVISSPPALLSVDGGPWSRITEWAGPWCVDERWWDPLGHRRKARIQVLTDPVGPTGPDRSGPALSPQAHLLTLEVGEWWVEATYD